MYRHLDLASACAEIQKAGCSGVDLWSSPRMCEHVAPGSSAAETKRIAQVHGLRIAALTAYHTLAPGASLERFLWSIEFASEIGAVCVVTNGVDWKGDLASFLRHLEPALELAAAREVTIALENHSSQSFSATQDHLLVIAQTVSSPFFGFTIAPPHLAIRGGDAADTIWKLRGRVSFFYAWDHILGVDDDGTRFIWPPPYPEHHFPGRGRLDFRSYLAALRGVGYEESAGWINIRSYPRYCSAPWETAKISGELKNAVRYVASLM